MAVELKSHGVTTISLWPGAVKTELVSDMILERDVVESAKFKVHLTHAARSGPSERFQNAQTSGFIFLSDEERFSQRRNHRTEWEVCRRSCTR